jgi:hypothetical protein
MMTASESVVEKRMPVWSALSELFLDTELHHADRERIAAMLAASPYSEEKLEEILRFEVTPTLRANLLSIAGEWAGFDEAWLREKLTPRIDKRPFLRFGVSLAIRAPWKEIIKRVSLLRAK